MEFYACCFGDSVAGQVVEVPSGIFSVRDAERPAGAAIEWKSLGAGSERSAAHLLDKH
jgi:hypothetical protein